jgi:predicted PurR-regulated permease PerM
VTSLLNDTTRSLGRAAGSVPLTTGVGIVVIVLVLVLVVEREVVRPLLSGERAERATRLGFALLPLAMVLAAVFASRIHHIVR